jgi:aconitate hydratase
METTPVRDITNARPRAARRQHHHGSHLARRIDKKDSPAGKYLIAHGVQPSDFNSRRATRQPRSDDAGTFANVRLRNQMAPGTRAGGRRTSRMAR